MSGLHPRRALPPTLPAGSRAVGHVGPTYAGRSDPVEPPTRSSDNASAGSRAVGRVGPTYASRPDPVEPNPPSVGVTSPTCSSDRSPHTRPARAAAPPATTNIETAPRR